MTRPDPAPARSHVLVLARRVVAYEIGMWRSLYRWLLPGPAAPGSTPPTVNSGR